MPLHNDFYYEEEDRYFLLHEDDPFLDTEVIPLPKFEGDITKVYNYGKPHEEQTYPYETVPYVVENIDELCRKHYNIKESEVVDFSLYEEYLKDTQIENKEVIEWCERVLHHRFHGQWVFIASKLTFIHRWHYFFVNFYFVDSDNPDREGYADYRDRDRKFYHALSHYYTTHAATFSTEIKFILNEKEQVRYFNNKKEVEDTKKNLDRRGIPYTVKSGKFYIEDTGLRTSYGVLYYKHRREGATYKAQCAAHCIQTEGYNRNNANQSKSDDHTDEVMRTKLIEPLRRMPFIFKAENKVIPKSYYSEKLIEWKSNRKGKKKGLGSYTKNAGAGEYIVDGSKYKGVIHYDEIAKKDSSTKMNHLKRWAVGKRAISQGAGRYIKGFSIHTSTVGDMTNDGGQLALNLAMQSLSKNTDSSGRTPSGLNIVFFSAYEGLDGTIDKFGNSVIEDPDEPIMGIDGKWIVKGSKTVIQEQINSLTASEDWAALNEFMRQHPTDFLKCFRKNIQDSPWNTEICEKRIEEIRGAKHPLTLNYDIYFSRGYGGPAQIRRDPFGKWKVSRIPESFEINAFIENNMGQAPAPNVAGKRCLGVDPFKYNKSHVQHKAMSSGAGALFYPFDQTVDNGKNIAQMHSNKFQMTYLHHTDSKEEFAKDMFACAVLTGAMIYPENNVNLIQEEAEKYNLTQYLIFEEDGNGKPMAKPGATTQGAAGQVVQKLFQWGSKYVNEYALYDNHLEMIEDFLNVSSPEDMTKADMFTAGVFAGVGSESKAFIFAKENRSSVINYDRLFNSRQII